MLKWPDYSLSLSWTRGTVLSIVHKDATYFSRFGRCSYSPVSLRLGRWYGIYIRFPRSVWGMK